MKKILAVFTLFLMILIITACSNDVNTVKLNNYITKEKDNMTKVETEYYGYLENLETFPINFVYNNVYYQGFNGWKVINKEQIKTNLKEENNITLELENIKATLKTAIYKDYDAYDYTVYFENTGTENSGVFKYINAIDLDFYGSNPHLKGILGDHVNQYYPYDHDLSEGKVNYTSLSGRATHVYFPYFNLENDNGGAMLAIGWAGTWKADFEEVEPGVVNFKAEGTVGLETYLKPEEIIRTPLMAVVRYFERNEEHATNKWRKWYVDCNMPRENAETDRPVDPCVAATLFLDTGRPNSDGSISEGYDSWKRSLDAIYNNGLEIDYRWFDAGWYYSPDMKTVPTDWWGTVGTWDLDKVKWPDNTFRESVDYAHEHGTDTLVWFEPERVTHIHGLVNNYGYKPQWAITDHGNNNCYLNNLGDKECYKWTLNRILSMMEENNVDLYREDFNFDPGLFFNAGDAYEGKNRKGITENLYYQGHYQLWDDIISWCAKNGKHTYVDSCASGGGRNDLESMRRGVPFLRSDSDRTTIPLRLAYTTTLSKWIVYNGAVAKDAAGQLVAGDTDIYVMRATYLAHILLDGEWALGNVDYDTINKGIAEWKTMNDLILEDFYVLTPYNGVNNTSDWTVYEYYNAEEERGVVQAFRPENNNEDICKVVIKGVDPNKYYTITDVEGYNYLNKVKGSMLLKGYNIYLPEQRSSNVIYINEYKN